MARPLSVATAFLGGGESANEGYVERQQVKNLPASFDAEFL